MCNQVPVGVALLLAAMMGVSALAHAGVTGDREPFVEHQRVTLSITGSDGRPLENREVMVVYYPGADIEREVAIGATDNRGELAWTPELAGLARVDVVVIPDEPRDAVMSRVVGVEYARVPPGALVMFCVAIVMLFGGLFVGVAKMRRDEV